MAWKISYTIKDEKGARAIMSFNVNDVDILTVVDLAASPLAFASEMATYIEPLISGQIVAINISIAVALPAGLKSAPELTSDVEEGATFTFATADRFPVRVRVPTFREALQTGEAVTTANAAVSDWVTMMVIPIETVGDWSVAPTDARGADLVGLLRARADFKRSRR